jgi:hypothetical protein
MILNPAILALVAGSAATALMIAGASVFGLQIIRGWDLSSGSERQLRLEKKTYLISTVMVALKDARRERSSAMSLNLLRYLFLMRPKCEKSHVGQILVATGTGTAESNEQSQI